jgi:hypothetical protein
MPIMCAPRRKTGKSSWPNMRCAGASEVTIFLRGTTPGYAGPGMMIAPDARPAHEGRALRYRRSSGPRTLRFPISPAHEGRALRYRRSSGPRLLQVRPSYANDFRSGGPVTTIGPPSWVALPTNPKMLCVASDDDDDTGDQSPSRHEPSARPPVSGPAPRRRILTRPTRTALRNPTVAR